MILASTFSNRSRIRPLLACAVLALALPSCGGPSDVVPLHPTSGQVLFAGQPLANLKIIFRPVSADTDGPVAVPIADTDAEGKFRLSTASGAEGRLTPGAPAGEYLVGIFVPRKSDSVDFLNKDKPRAAADPLNGRFADPRTSGLKATIKPGDNNLEPFRLDESSGAQPAALKSRDR